MKTIQQLSTAELRKLEAAFKNPKSLTETILLMGVKYELQAIEDEISRINFPSALENSETPEFDGNYPTAEDIVFEIIGER